MGHQDGLGKLFSFGREFRKCIHQGSKVGPCVPEKILDAPVAEKLEVSLSGVVDGDGHRRILTSAEILPSGHTFPLKNRCEERGTRKRIYKVKFSL
jgi:hypothetical protein